MELLGSQRGRRVSVLVAVRGSIPSPCVAVCVINTETKFCLGCYRTIEEIGGWMMMDDDRRLAVLEELKQRRAADPDAKPRRERKRPPRKRD